MQAHNLIRALRQNREAAALGLLEGQTQPGEDKTDIEVSVNKVCNFLRTCPPIYSAENLVTVHQMYQYMRISNNGEIHRLLTRMLLDGSLMK